MRSRESSASSRPDPRSHRQREAVDALHDPRNSPTSDWPSLDLARTAAITRSLAHRRRGSSSAASSADLPAFTAHTDPDATVVNKLEGIITQTGDGIPGFPVRRKNKRQFAAIHPYSRCCRCRHMASWQEPNDRSRSRIHALYIIFNYLFTTVCGSPAATLPSKRAGNSKSSFHEVRPGACLWTPMTS